MNIQLNTDKHIDGNKALEQFVNEKLKSTLKHLANHITRIEVHLSDQNGDKSGADDIQCKIEARIENRQPVMVTSRSDSKEKAINEAADKVKAKVSSIVSKMQAR
jgi:ribosome-associated translation inhibitor RaiA